MDVRDYVCRGQRRMWIQLKEKGGRQHAMPCHHKLEEYLDAYLQAAGINDQMNSPLFRSAKGRTGVLTENRLRRGNAYEAIRRRARQAGRTHVEGRDGRVRTWPFEPYGEVLQTHQIVINFKRNLALSIAHSAM